jgi:hypothetical protein
MIKIISPGLILGFIPRIVQRDQPWEKINESAKRSSREPKRSEKVYTSLEAFWPERCEKSEALYAQVKGVEQHVAQKSDRFCVPLFFLSQDERPGRAIAGGTSRGLHLQYLRGLLSTDHAERAREAASPSSGFRPVLFIGRDHVQVNRCPSVSTARYTLLPLRRLAPLPKMYRSQV